MRKDDCIFCKLASGEIPSTTLYEDDVFRVILDLGPAAKGHGLILPKEHFDNLYELDDKHAERVMPLARKMAAAMTKALGADGFNLVQNNGEEAGQTVFHFHMHLIPRYKGGNEVIQWTAGEADKEELKQIAIQVQKQLETTDCQ